jgi:hydrogenase assembly chaperone HypC/HupF
MCQAIPRPVLRVDGARIEVDVDGRPQWVTAAGLPTVAPGDYVIVYAGAALEPIPQPEAEEMLRFFADLDGLLAESAETEAAGQGS